MRRLRKGEVIIMAELKCGVENCSYNKEKCCCKGDIMVGGKHADCCNDTCCESFAQKRRVPIPALWNILVGRSVLIVKRRNVCIIVTINATRSMWTSWAAARVPAPERSALLSGKHSCGTGQGNVRKCPLNRKISCAAV